MSEENFVKPLKCPSCKHELKTIDGEDVTANYKLVFSQKRGTYIPHSTILAIDRFVCPHCGEELPSSLFESQMDKNIVAVQPRGDYKTILIDLQEIPFDIKNAELYDKLPKTIKIPRGRAKDTIEDLNADDFLTSGRPWRKKKEKNQETKGLTE